MTFLIDGVDYVDYIAAEGLKWSRHDVDAPNTGRAMNALMYRGRVATKIRLDITCRLLTGDEAHNILNAIMPEYVQVTYDDPMDGLVTRTMYANENPANFRLKKTDGREMWAGVTFPLVER